MRKILCVDEQQRTELGRWLDAERGRAAELARRCGVAPPEVSDWASGKKTVPVRHCPTVEEFAGIQCERLQPGVRWYVLRNSAMPIGTTPAVEVVTPDPGQAANDEPNQDRAA